MINSEVQYKAPLAICSEAAVFTSPDFCIQLWQCAAATKEQHSIQERGIKVLA